MENNETRFRSYPVMHLDGTTGRVMANDNGWLRISFRENGKEETIEIRESDARGIWVRAFR